MKTKSGKEPKKKREGAALSALKAAGGGLGLQIGAQHVDHEGGGALRSGGIGIALRQIGEVLRRAVQFQGQLFFDFPVDFLFRQHVPPPPLFSFAMTRPFTTS